MKAYTDLKQSKKLAEILPLESANMTYFAIVEGLRDKMSIKGWEVNIGLDVAIKEKLFSYRNGYMFPCWSLTALLSVLPFNLIVDNRIYAFSMIKGLDKNGETYALKYAIFNTTFYLHLTDFYNNPVDACYEMIIKLNELNLL